MDRLERVNYYPGQRLLADDLNDQESYEIRLRHLLNSGLFSSGVVSGLEVTKKSSKEITVAFGLALDHRGRELFLAGQADMPVPNQPPLTAPGYYLVIRFRETAVTGRLADCVPSGAQPPSRFRLEPILEFTEVYPDPKVCPAGDGDFNCGVVLAMVRLNESCEIASVDTGFRQFSYPTHMSRVTAMALEGEKDVNTANPKKLRFHVRGGNPNSVVLILRGARFSDIFYTELGSHSHGLTLGSTQTQAQTADISHNHAIQQFNTLSAGSHAHRVLVRAPFTYALGNASVLGWHYQGMSDKIPLVDDTRHEFIETDGNHQHTVTARTTEGASPNTSGTHQHGVLGLTANTDATGTEVLARVGSSLGFLDGLTIHLDGTDITAKIRDLLGWPSMAAGGSGDKINGPDGTGAIDLVRLPGIVIEIGPHDLEFRVAKGGGKLMYHLYIE
jgi:hypothetical protein